MKQARLTRFVFLGAAGFGIGGAIAAASWPLLIFTFGASALLFVLSGAVGGASLGLALGDRRTAVKLALLGILGTLIGGIVTLVIAFLFLASDEALYGVRGAMGVFAGAIVGASLGLAFWDWKRVLVLTLSGAVGFGAGVIVGTFFLRSVFGGDFMAGTPGTIILYAVTGVIGGASLGASLGYFERATQLPRGQTMLRLAALASVPLIGGLLFVSFVLPGSNICGEEERAAFSEFPQYGGIEKEPESDSQSGGCAVFYETSAPPAEVAAYFAEQLIEHGWTVEHQLEAKGDGSDQFGGELVTAYRDGLRYDASYESLEFYEPPRPGTHVAVHVSEGRQEKKLSCGSEEKAALAEFPHYGDLEESEDLELRPLRGKTEGACVTGYPAKGASQEQVSAYYEEKLMENGWKVEQSSDETKGSRDGLRYVVHYWSNPGATEVEVQVFRP